MKASTSGVQVALFGASRALRLGERPFYRARRSALWGLGWSLPRATRVERWLVWLGLYPTVVGVSRGQWGLVTFGLGELVLGLGLVLFLVRRNARFRRTAAVNGWPIEAAT